MESRCPLLVLTFVDLRNASLANTRLDGLAVGGALQWAVPPSLCHRNEMV